MLLSSPTGFATSTTSRHSQTPWQQQSSSMSAALLHVLATQVGRHLQASGSQLGREGGQHGRSSSQKHAACKYHAYYVLLYSPQVCRLLPPYPMLQCHAEHRTFLGLLHMLMHTYTACNCRTQVTACCSSHYQPASQQPRQLKASSSMSQ